MVINESQPRSFFVPGKEPVSVSARRTKRIADNALVASACLIAESRPAEKEILVQVVANLINKKNM